MIRLSGTYTFEALRRAAWLNLRPSKRIGWYLTACCLLVVAGLVVPPLARGSSFWSVFPMLLVLSGMPLVMWFATNAVIRIGLAKNRMLQDRLDGVATPELIELTSPHGSSRIPWADYYNVKRSAEVLLLYQGPQNMQLIPRQFVESDAEWQQLGAWATDGITTPRLGGAAKAGLLLLGFMALVFLLNLLFLFRDAA